MSSQFPLPDFVDRSQFQLSVPSVLGFCSLLF